MEYLARKAFVHRDLAVRNILVAEDKTCKVCGSASDTVYSPGYFHRAGGSWFICPCPCAVALLCAVSLANDYNTPTAVDAKLSYTGMYHG